MKLKFAVTLLSQAISAFNETTAEKDKRKLAEVVVNLRETLPNLLSDDEAIAAFLDFATVVRDDTIASGRILIEASMNQLLQRIPKCLENSDYVNCGGPPSRQSKCDLCGKRGKL